MKNTIQLLNIILIFAMSCFTQLAIAQIVYTNVIPDQTCNTDGCAYNLDLNNDNIIDFAIEHTYSLQNGGMCHGTYPSYSVKITPSSGDEVATGARGKPDDFETGSLIGATLTWNSTESQPLGELTGKCLCVDGCSWTSDHKGNWSGDTDKYLGLRITAGGNKYYGWARLDVGVDGASFTIKDYAYNNIADQSILAGDSGSIATNIHHIKGFSSLAISPNSLQHLTRISFSISQPEKTTLVIYDVTGRVIKILADEMMSAGARVLVWDARDENGNAVSDGIYFLKMETANQTETIHLNVVK